MARTTKPRRTSSRSATTDAGRRPSSAIGIKDLAARLGVSIGTVDRALNGKRGINADTCARVLAEARSLGYRPNLAARYLRSRRHVRISVHLPANRSLFWETLKEGSLEAAAPLAPSLAVEVASDPDVDLASPPAATGTHRGHGRIINGHHPALAARLGETAEGHIPVACVAAEAPADPRFISVSADPFSVGALAGELIGRFVPGGGEIAIVADSLTSQAHTARVRGFSSTLASVSPRSALATLIESHPQADETARRIRALLRAYPRVRGLCITAADALPVLRALDEEGQRGEIQVVVTHLSPELFDGIRAGRIAAAIYQRPLTQGRLAVQLLYQLLQDGAIPAARQRVVAPYAVMRSNLDLVLDRLAIARAASSASSIQGRVQ
jgi:LacI family transcriptional regulator